MNVEVAVIAQRKGRNPNTASALEITSLCANACSDSIHEIEAVEPI